MEFDPRPVYEGDQVITMYDLIAIRNGYVYQYQESKWYQVVRKFKFRAGVGVINEILHWLSHGKPHAKETVQ
jgi:hypothetical protein